MTQLELFDALGHIRVDEASTAEGVRCLYTSGARGLAARASEFQEWTDRHGRFGCIARSHAWRPHNTDADRVTEQCRATVLVADLRCLCPWTCFCVGLVIYRGACCGCRWEGVIRTDHEHAVLDALDHTSPGWRADPPVPAAPFDDNLPARARWVARVTARIGGRPDGWPVRTLRIGLGYAAVARRSPWGGYDVDDRTLR